MENAVLAMGVALRHPIARAHIVWHVPKSEHVLLAMMALALPLQTLTVRVATCAKTRENAPQNRENALLFSMTIAVARRGAAKKARAWREKKDAVWPGQTRTARGRSCARKAVCVPQNLAHASRSQAIVYGLKCANNAVFALPCKDNVASTPMKTVSDQRAVVQEAFAPSGQVDALQGPIPIAVKPLCARNEAGAKRKKDAVCASDDR